MVDATRVPKRMPYMYGPTITFELKPKQGFYQIHPGLPVSFCNNCILQLQKWRSASFERMYDFCPLDLYSGDLMRMRTAITSLIRDPRRFIRLKGGEDRVRIFCSFFIGDGGFHLFLAMPMVPRM